MATARVKKTIRKESPENQHDNLIQEGFNEIIARAASMGASDIHIEPRESLIWIRYRVGSNLKTGTKLPISAMKPLSEFGKKLAGISIQSENRPQEGVFDFETEGQKHNIHLSVMPLLSGEKMVLHLTPRSYPESSLRNLGYWGNNLDKIEKVIRQTRGLVIVSSTDRNSGLITISAMLGSLSHPAIQISVVGETLAEYLSYNNSNVKYISGLPPYAALRALIKNAPDVIVVDDFTDRKMVELVLEAAAKRLVIVRSLAEDSASILQRLSNIDFQQRHYLGNLKLVINQSVIPKLCQFCHNAYRPTNHIIKLFDDISDDFPIGFFHEQEKKAVSNGIGRSYNNLGTSKSGITNLWRSSNYGCVNCEYSGFFGFTTINEAVDTSGPLLQKKLSVNNSTQDSILSAALDEAMCPKLIDGIIKSVRGEVDLDDVIQSTNTSFYNLSII